MPDPSPAPASSSTKIKAGEFVVRSAKYGAKSVWLGGAMLHHAILVTTAEEDAPFALTREDKKIPLLIDRFNNSKITFIFFPGIKTKDFKYTTSERQTQDIENPYELDETVKRISAMSFHTSGTIIATDGMVPVPQDAMDDDERAAGTIVFKKPSDLGTRPVTITKPPETEEGEPTTQEVTYKTSGESITARFARDIMTKHKLERLVREVRGPGGELLYKGSAGGGGVTIEDPLENRPPASGFLNAEWQFELAAIRDRFLILPKQWYEQEEFLRDQRPKHFLPGHPQVMRIGGATQPKLSLPVGRSRQEEPLILEAEIL